MHRFIVFFLFMICLALSDLESVYALPAGREEAATMINDFVKDQKGIELYYMLETLDDQAISLQKMAALMEYHGRNVPEIIHQILEKMKAREYPYGISSINAKAGFMRLQGKGFEVAVSMVYWNIDNSRKLLGTLEATCTMVCESNRLRFTLFKDNRVSDAKFHVDIPRELFKPEYFLINRSDTSVFEQDAAGVAVELPEKGMDILFRLQNMPADRKIFRGNCVKLAWQKREAGFRVEPPEFCE